MTGLCVQNGKVVQFSHYFYQSHLADIPLGGVVDPVSTVALKEPGGGASLSISSAMAATEARHSTSTTASAWPAFGRALTARAYRSRSALTSAPAAPRGRQWYREITSQSDAQFEARVQGFTKTVLAGDRAGTARHVHFPLTVNLDGKTIEVRTPADLDRRWDEIFAPLWLKALAGTLPHDLFVKPGDGAAMIGDGLVWFDEHGARTINAKPPS